MYEGMVFNAGAADVDISDNDSYYFVEGTNVQFAQKTGNDTWKATVKVGSKDATDLTGASYTPSGADDIVITFLKAVEEVTVTLTELANSVSTKSAAVAAVKAMVTVPTGAFTVEADTEKADADFTAGAQNLPFTITLTPGAGYYFAGNATVSAGSDVEIAANGDLTFTVTVNVAQ